MANERRTEIGKIVVSDLALLTYEAVRDA